MAATNLPAVCDFSITDLCNAAWDFCGFARDETLIGPARELAWSVGILIAFVLSALLPAVMNRISPGEHS